MFVARESELGKLKKIAEKQKSSFLAVYGRRRIGKTAIIRHFCQINEINKIEFSGKVNQTKAQQITSFVRNIERIANKKNHETIQDWNNAFYLLTTFIDSLSDKEKVVIFFDELPWIDTAKSGFLAELATFWNDFCWQRKNIILIVCGSAASYMLKKVIHNKGSLHGRLTDIMPMQQFDLNASKQMLVAEGCRYSNKSIVDTYMILGGVAKYIESLDCKKTPSESINDLCFTNDALLKYEYEDLFSSLFNNSKVHYRIMNVLSAKWSGYNKIGLAQLVKVSTAYIKKPVDELLASGFISTTTRFNQTKRDVIYRATDCFSSFYNKWMINNRDLSFHNIVNTQGYKSWAGFAFENICHMHIHHIKKILGISGVPIKSHYWNYIAKNTTETGAQIDLLLEHVNGSKNIDIIECKYYSDVYTLSKSYKQAMQTKINIFNQQTNFKYNIRLIFITSHGMEKNEHYNEIVNLDINIKDIIETKI